MLCDVPAIKNFVIGYFFMKPKVANNFVETTILGTTRLKLIWRSKKYAKISNFEMMNHFFVQMLNSNEYIIS